MADSTVQLTNEINDLALALKKANENAIELARSTKAAKTNSDKAATGYSKQKEGVESIARSTKKLSALQKERARISEQTKKVFAKNLALQEKGAKTLLKGQVKLTEATRKAREEEKKNQGIIKKSGGLFKSMTKSILAAGAAYLSLRAAISVIKSSLKTIIGFEKGMSAVKAITGATVKEFKALQANALSLGASTAKTAIEVAGLQKEYAKLGFTTAEIIAATEATINLSIAAESDLAEAAVVAASTIRGFGKSATETRHITDVMAKSFTTTGLNLEKFKVAMANAQVAAKSTGKSLEFTAAALGTIIDTGTDASKAGTDLKRILSQLAKEGISLEQAYEMVNGSSNKVVAAMDLVGDRAFSSLITLAENTEKVNELTVAYENSSGAAQEMADIMADNLAGDLTLTTSAWQGFILSLNKGDGVISQSIRGLTQLTTKALNFFTALNSGEGIAVQKLKSSMDFENRINEIRERSIKVVKKKAEQENKTTLEVAQSLAKEAKLRSDAADAAYEANQKILEDDKKLYNDIAKAQAFEAARLADATLQVRRDLEKENYAIFENIVAAEVAAAEASVKAEQEAANQKIALAAEVAAEKTKAVDKELDRQVAKTRAIRIKEADDNLLFLDYELEQMDAFLEAEAEKEARTTAEIIADEQAQKDAARALDEQKTKESEDRKKEIKLAAVDAAGQVLSDQLTAFIDNNLAEFEAGQEAELKILEDKLDKKEISEEDFTKETARIRKESQIKQAKADKKKAIFDSVINTLVSVGKTFATLGYPAGIPAAIAAGVVGAIQTAAIVARPIPKFKHGTTNSPKGLLEFGEAGPEAVFPSDGSAPFLATERTISPLPTGSTILSNPDTQLYLNGGMSEEKMDQLIGATKNNKPIQHNIKTTHITDMGAKTLHVKNNNYIQHNEDWFRG